MLRTTKSDLNLKPNAIKLLLFDLGGVLVELGESPLPPTWFERADISLSPRQWLHSPSAVKFESGLIGKDEFARSLKTELGLAVSTQDIIAEFTDWPRGLLPGTERILNQLKDNFRLAVLSNSNELHWHGLTLTMGLQSYMEKMYSSHLLRVAKPDQRAFNAVLDDLNMDAGEVLFFDDNRINVEAAQSLGMSAVQVSGPDAIEAYLVERKLMPSASKLPQ